MAQLKSKAFPQGGFYILRHDDSYMIIDCVPADTKAPSGHKHNSRLSFELFAYDKSFIIDPGAYIYTADKEMRNLFRSTKYHNTVVVDGEEQNRFDEDKLFSIRCDATVKVNRWVVTDKYDFLDAEHNGYARLKDPVIHRRQIYFDKEDRYWIIKDTLTGKERNKFDLYFHFAPMNVGLLAMNKNVLMRIRRMKNQLIDGEIKIDESFVIETKNNDGANLLVIPLNVNDLSIEILNGWISYGYGTKEKASIIKYSKVVNCPTEFLTLLYPVFLSE
jgi:hypothetical protein